MNILNSKWLIKMLEKSSNMPRDRMLNLFDVLGDWLEAPGINNSLNNSLISNNHRLQEFLANEAAEAGAAMPEMLANQLYLMAFAVMQDNLSYHQENRLNDAITQDIAYNMRHAKSAARALIVAQTRLEIRFEKSSIYAMAASFTGVLVVVGSLMLFNFNQLSTSKIQQIAALQANSKPATSKNSLFASAEDTAALIAQINQMRNGNCQLIEAIQLPDSYKKVYFENIVLGQISTNLTDQKLVVKLLEKVRCNYTPMLMANSK